MKALVIGGAGFIGSNLCGKLLSDGWSALSLDNYSTGSERNHIQGVKYKRGECRDLGRYSMPRNVDVVFHLGEYSRVEQSEAEPMVAMNGICSTVYPVIEYCYRIGAKLIYSGSSTRFGDQKSVYSICKSSNAGLVHELCRHLGIDYAITYFYNVYGPGEIGSGKYATLIAKALEAKAAGESITVNWPGTQRRNFTHVSDIVRGLTMVAAQGYGDGYGIGSEESYSVIELCDMAGVDYSIGPEQRGNRMSSDLVSDKTKRLGWDCQVSLPDYLRSVGAEV